MDTIPTAYIVWVDAFRFCVMITAGISLADLFDSVKTNVERSNSSPRGRALSWLFVCLGSLAGAGIPFIRGLFSITWVADIRMAQIVIATWFLIFIGLSFRMADRSDRKALILLCHLSLIPIAWFASSIKHGVL